jgi:murein DD-endopeptidase MepM/ murein hydrolase activator NlpD
VKQLSAPAALAVLASLFAPAAQAQEARAQVIQLDALKPVFPPRQLNAGQEIVLDVAEALKELRFSTAVDRDIVVSRGGDGNLAARVEPRRLTRTTELASGSIRTTLYKAASDAGVPMPVLAEMIRSFSYDVDFQRDLQPGDRFEVLFERLYDARGKAVGTGAIAYAALTLSGRTIKLYRYLSAGAQSAEFFTERGESVKKAVLRTPVDGARLSSGFGMRLHPILGYTKLHRGIDFAAPPGAPIMAASDGVVASAGPSGAYGNLVVLRHAGVYETAYAHMSRIARAITPGTPVRQGEVIGYVGATGRATGPHLHYEVRINGEPIDPVAIETQPGQALAGQDLVRFPELARTVDRQLAALRRAVVVAGTPGGRLDP